MEFSWDFSVMVALATSAILSSFVTVYFFRKVQTKQSFKERDGVDESVGSRCRDETNEESSEDIIVYNALMQRLRGDRDDLSDLLQSNPPTDEDEDIDELVVRNSTDEDEFSSRQHPRRIRDEEHPRRIRDEEDDNQDDSDDLQGPEPGVVSERIKEVASSTKMWEQRFAEQNSPLAARRFLDVPANGDRSNSSSRSASPAFLERLSRAEKRSNSPTIYDTVENHDRSRSPSFYNSSRSNSPLADACAKYEQRPHTSDSDSDHEPAHVRRRGSPRVSEEAVRDVHVSELRQQWESGH